MTGRHIVMVGTAASRVSAPVADKSAEIWGVSSRGTLPRADRWFELHPIDYTFEKAHEADEWRKLLSEFTADVPELWMMFPEPNLHPNVITYPLERIKARFGTDHMASTFSWMMAVAIDEMAPIDADGTRHFAEPGSKISIYGVDMEFGTEYEEQRKGFKAMMSIAEQLGIEIRNVLSGGLIYDPVPYPMWQIDPLICKADRRIKETDASLKLVDEAIIRTREMICTTQGSLAEVALMQAGDIVAEAMKGEDNPPKPYVPEERVKFLNEQLQALKETSMKISTDIVGYSSANECNRYWRKVFMG
jgi:hypothetical protein